MKSLILIATLLLGLASPALADWPAAAYTEVRAYAYNLDGHSRNPAIIVDGKLHPTVVNPAGVKLSKKQEVKLLAALNGKHSPHPVASCFIPRHAFVFYDHEKVVASVDVCFECMATESTPKGIIYPDDLAALAELCDAMKLPRSPGPGYRRWLEEFSKPQR